MVALIRRQRDGVEWFEDAELRDRDGILVAFSMRRGGVSDPPFDSLNLAGHVGDVPADVDENRRRWMSALGLDDVREALVTAEQVHGESIARVGQEQVGSGSRVEHGRASIAAADALQTTEVGLPLMLLFADCVPVVLVDPVLRSVTVVHAGWRGALAGLPGKAVASLSRLGSAPGSLLAYIGPHICAEHYEVSNNLLTSFVDRFGKVAAAEAGHLDLGAVVSADLSSAGVEVHHICRLGICTAEATDRFFSYRAASGTTGRHSAVAAVLR